MLSRLRPAGVGDGSAAGFVESRLHARRQAFARERLLVFRAQEPFEEIICQEGNFQLFGDDYGIPQAAKPDF